MGRSNTVLSWLFATIWKVVFRFDLFSTFLVWLESSLSSLEDWDERYSSDTNRPRCRECGLCVRSPDLDFIVDKIKMRN